MEILKDCDYSQRKIFTDMRTPTTGAEFLPKLICQLYVDSMRLPPTSLATRLTT